MFKRTVSGTAFVIIVAGFFLLREFVDPRLFQILTWFVATVATFEMARAVKRFTFKIAFYIAVAFGFVLVPVYCLCEYFLFPTYGWALIIGLIALSSFTTLVAAFMIKADGKKTLTGLAPFVYPSLFILAMLLVNDLDKGFIALLLIFVISPFSDTLAYFTGSLIGGPKLCPKLSPKKTWAGAMGGIAGGIIGSVLVWLIFKPEVNFFSPVLLFIIVGFVGSVFTEIGDLFESYIKRKIGIKDMGNIMPGHGGMLDRFDGMFFAAAFIYLVFLFV